MSVPEESAGDRQSRLGRNEVLFRGVNDRMEELNDVFAAVTDEEFVVVCECGDLACVQQIVVLGEQYARVRAGTRLFVLVRGHEDASVEAVVEDDERFDYLVVQKHPGVLATKDAGQGARS